MNLEGRVAIVTGASSGIGLAVARQLVGGGARVALVARTRDKLEEVERELGADRAAAFPLDVRDLGGLKSLPSAVEERFGQLDILVNNAGLNHRGPVLEHTPEALAEIITTNLTAPIYLTRAAVAKMDKGGGVIVNVASLAGMVPVPHEAAYSASKAGLRAFTRALADELRGSGIEACLVSPGPVDTGFFGDVETVPDLVFSQPMRTAEQIAGAVLDCIRTGAGEIAVPALSGKLATVAYVFPGLGRALRPLLEKRGAANKRAYLARKGKA
jgi:short-subunit dehydrogenase